MAVATMPTTESAEADEQAILAAQEILAAKGEQLRALELQEAQFGWFTPPYIRNQIRVLRRELERAQRVAPQSDGERWSLLYNELRDVRDEVRDVRASQRQLYILLPVLMVLISLFLAVVVTVGSQRATIRPSAAPASAGSVAPATPIAGRDTPLIGGH